jgi:hypothetical protein
MASIVFKTLGIAFGVISLLLYLLERWLRKQEIDPLAALMMSPPALAMTEENDELLLLFIRIIAGALAFLSVVLFIASLFL